MNVTRMFGNVCSVRKRVRVFRFRMCSDACSAERVQDSERVRECSDFVQCSANVFRLCSVFRISERVQIPNMFRN